MDKFSDLMLNEIEDFLKQHDMSATRLGLLFNNDGHLVRNLRSGRSITLKTADKLRVFMREHTRRQSACACARAVQIWLPWPPSVNNLFSQDKRGRRFPSRKYQWWRTQADMEILAQRIKPISGPVHIKLELTAPDKRPRDGDNFLKAPLDALVRMGVLTDDNNECIAGHEVVWAKGRPPGVVVTVEPKKNGQR